MDQKNICKFIPFRGEADAIRTLHFVCETEHSERGDARALSYARAHYVSEGRGTLRTGGKSFPLAAGDVFFVFPGQSYALDAAEGMRLLYVGFLGLRANMLMEQLSISAADCVRAGHGEAKDTLTHIFELSAPGNLQTAAESALLYLFAVLQKSADAEGENPPERLSRQIQKYIDARFDDPELTAKTLGAAFSYNPRYLAELFRRQTGSGVNEYILSLRLQRACSLMRENITSVKDIAGMCGFADALYFSKVFKKNMGVCPRAFMQGAR